jgi:CHC2 zinc finger
MRAESPYHVLSHPDTKLLRLLFLFYSSLTIGIQIYVWCNGEQMFTEEKTPMTLVNYKEIKARIKMEQVLERYGVLGDLREKGDSLVGRCPIHKGSNANQFHVSRTKNNFMCFGDCHEGGNVIDFVVMMEGGDKKSGDDVRSAAMRLQEWFGLTFERPQGGRRAQVTASVSAVGTASAATIAVALAAPVATQPALPLAKTMKNGTPAGEPEPTPMRDETHLTQDLTPVAHRPLKLGTSVLRPMRHATDTQAPVRLGGKGGQGIEVRKGLPVGVQGLDADMAGPRLDMGLEALSDGRLVAPGDHSVQKSGAAAVR